MSAKQQKGFRFSASQLKGLIALLAMGAVTGVVQVARNFDSWWRGLRHGVDELPEAIHPASASEAGKSLRGIPWDEFEEGLDWAAKEYLTGNAVQDAGDLYEHVQECVKDWERDPTKLKRLCEAVPAKHLLGMNIPGGHDETLLFAAWQNYVDSLYSELGKPGNTLSLPHGIYQNSKTPEQILLNMYDELVSGYRFQLQAYVKSNPHYGKLIGEGRARPYKEKFLYIETHPLFSTLIEYAKRENERRRGVHF